MSDKWSGGWLGRPQLPFWERIWWFIKWDVKNNWFSWLTFPLWFPVAWLIKQRLDAAYTWICDQHPGIAETFGSGTGAVGELYSFVMGFAGVLVRGYRRPE